MESKFRSWKSLQWNKEKLECSKGIHKEKIWHQIRNSRSGDTQKVCQIVEMKIRGKILCAKRAWRLALSMKRITSKPGQDWWNETLSTEGHEFQKTFRYCYYLLEGDLTSNVNVSLLQPIKTFRYSLCSENILTASTVFVANMLHIVQLWLLLSPSKITWIKNHYKTFSVFA